MTGKTFQTLSGIPVEAVYGDGPLPGEFPYTRGVHPDMYRSRLWTMRMFAGFGTAEDTNTRFRELLRSGGTGLSTAFDMPTLMGRDSDHEWALGEVGRAGVAVDTVEDMADLFAGIDLGAVSTSMTINGPAPILLAMYVVVAEESGVERSRLAGTLQNDILKEYQALHSRSGTGLHFGQRVCIRGGGLRRRSFGGLLCTAAEFLLQQPRGLL